MLASPLVRRTRKWRITENELILWASKDVPTVPRVLRRRPWICPGKELWRCSHSPGGHCGGRCQPLSCDFPALCTVAQLYRLCGSWPLPATWASRLPSPASQGAQADGGGAQRHENPVSLPRGAVPAPEPVSGVWLQLGFHLWSHPCLASSPPSCFPALPGLSREPFLDKSLSQECLAQDLLLGEPDLRSIRQAPAFPAVHKPQGHSASEVGPLPPENLLAAQTVCPPKPLHLHSRLRAFQQLGPSVQNSRKESEFLACLPHSFMYILPFSLCTNHFNYRLPKPCYSFRKPKFRKVMKTEQIPTPIRCEAFNPVF